LLHPQRMKDILAPLNQYEAEMLVLKEGRSPEGKITILSAKLFTQTKLLHRFATSIYNAFRIHRRENGLLFEERS
jgi:hypothetical protein